MNQSFTSTVIAGLGVKTVQYQQIDTATYHDVEIFQFSKKNTEYYYAPRNGHNSG